MLVPMTKVRILGRRDRRSRCSTTCTACGSSSSRTSRARSDAGARADARRAMARGAARGAAAAARAARRAARARAAPRRAGGGRAAGGPASSRPDASTRAPSRRAEPGRACAPRVEELTGRVEALGSEEVVVGRYVDLLRRVLELVPELEELDAGGRRCGSARSSSCSAARTRASPSCCGRSCARCWAAASCSSRPLSKARSAACSSTRSKGAAAVEELLDRRRVRQLPLPDAYRDLVAGVAGAMEQRLTEMPEEIARSAGRARRVLCARRARLGARTRRLAARLEHIDAVGWAGTTERVFVAARMAAAPRARAAARWSSSGASAPEVVVEELPTSRRDTRAPVLLQNRRSRTALRVRRPLLRRPARAHRSTRPA